MSPSRLRCKYSCLCSTLRAARLALSLILRRSVELTPIDVELCLALASFGASVLADLRFVQRSWR